MNKQSKTPEADGKLKVWRNPDVSEKHIASISRIKV
jgi:hypothetical protein